MRKLLFVATVLAPAFTKPAVAQTLSATDVRDPGWYLQGGAYVHYKDDEDYEGPPLFVGLEYVQSEKWRYGFSMFQNSFGQFSQYAYAARMFRPFEQYPNVHFKVTAGIVQGYRGEHHDTLPIRWDDSWGIGAIPTIGYRKDRFGFDIAFLKASAALFLVGYHFD